MKRFETNECHGGLVNFIIIESRGGNPDEKIKKKKLINKNHEDFQFL